MKILYINYLYDLKESSSGANVHVTELARALEQLGHRVVVRYMNRFTSVEAAESASWRRMLKKRLSRYLGGVNAVISNAAYFLKECRALREIRPDAILVRYNWYQFSLAVAAWIYRIPWVVEVNSPMVYENRHFSPNRFHLYRLAAFIEGHMMRWAGAVYVVSHELKRYFMREYGIPEKKITVIPNGVDETRIHPGLSGEGVRKRYDLAGKTVIGFIGTFHYWHGVEALFDFMAVMLEDHPDVRFLLVGEGPLRAELIRRIQKAGLDKQIFLPGFIAHDEIPHHLAAMDIVLAPYPPLDFFYYSPLKLFEYMAAGKCVVASRQGQIGQIIEHGINGMLFEPINYRDMSLNVGKLLKNKRMVTDISKAARLKVEKNFTWKHTARKVSTLLKQLIN